MKVERLAVKTGFMRTGMTLRDFFEEAVRCNVPGLPFVDENDRIVGRISVRHTFKNIAVPDSILRLADAMGDQTDRLDLSEKRVLKALALPVETFMLEKIPSVSPRSALVKALAIMEAYNSTYVFLREDGEYGGVVTRMIIARRMLESLKELEQSPETA
jgi:CBS domain-containing protein